MAMNLFSTRPSPEVGNFQEIIRSPEFHFLVGPDRQKLTVHAGLVQHLSVPLGALMNNGCMKESVSREATLDDVEEETFIAFCEFGYRGRYTTPNRKGGDTSGQSQKPEPSGVPPLFPPLTTFGSDDTRRPRNNNNGVLFGGTGETSQTNNHGLPIRQNTTSGGLFGQPPQSQVRGTGLFGMPQPSQADDNKDSYARRWDEFRSLSFFLDVEATYASNPDLLAHAKVYVFATRYLVYSLKNQCIKSLHRDLCRFSVNPQNASHFLDLLEYTYENTGRQEPESVYSLRKLVIHYVACEVRELVKNSRFLRLLDEYGEIGSDLVAKLVV